MFVYHIPVKMHYIDAAGVMFFGQFFYLAHDAYEAFLDEISFAIKDILPQDFLIPLIHAEADYKAPVNLGDVLTIGLQIEKIGRTSFTVGYQMTNQLGRTVALVKTVHTTISNQTRQPMAIPPHLREALQRFTP